MRTCSKCGVPKPISEFGMTRAVAGRKVLRAQCRPCYNVRRREHYSTPNVHEVKLTKRRQYELRSDVSARRGLIRSLPENKAKEKLARVKYRSRPEVAASLKAKKAAHRAKPEIKAQGLLGSCRLRATKFALPFDLDAQWINQRVMAGRCELSGIEFDYGPAPNGWRYNPKSPSVDQIIAGAGYTKANCRVILTSINNALSQYGEDYFTEVAVQYLLARGYSVYK